MTYTVKNRDNNQDNVNFIDMTGKNMPDFLDYDEVLAYSLKNGCITSEDRIKSLCDGGDHINAYFSEESAAYECDIYLSYDKGLDIFNPETSEYEVY